MPIGYLLYYIKSETALQYVLGFNISAILLTLYKNIAVPEILLYLLFFTCYHV